MRYDAFLPEGDVLDMGEAGKGAQAAFARFDWGRVPANLGRPIAETERIIQVAGEVDLLRGSARAVLFDALYHHRQDALHLMRARLVQAVGLAVKTLGNPSLGAELGLERHFRDIQAGWSMPHRKTPPWRSLGARRLRGQAAVTHVILGAARSAWRWPPNSPARGSTPCWWPGSRPQDLAKRGGEGRTSHHPFPKK